MNGIEKITGRLMADAQAEVELINADADAQCSAILAEYEAKAAEEYAKRLAKGEADCAARSERLAATADMEKRKATLAFKQKLIGEAFAKAVEAVAKLPREEYIAFLSALAAEAATSGEAELIFSETDRAAVGAEVAERANGLVKDKGGKLSLSVETADIPGGFIMRSGNIEINCAADALVGLQRSSLSSQVAEILFS